MIVERVAMVSGTVRSDRGARATRRSYFGFALIFSLCSIGMPPLIAAAQQLSFGSAVVLENTASSDTRNAIAVDGMGNFYVVGVFSGTADFDTGAGTFELTSVGVADIFITKWDSAGTFLWTRALSGPDLKRVDHVAFDNAGNIYTTGFFQGTVDFDPGLGNFSLTSAGQWDVFISKLDASGNFQWAVALGGGGDDRGNSIALNGSGDVYVTGYFSNIADMDPGGGTFNLTSMGAQDIFVAKLDASGALVWARGIGGAGWDEAHASAVDSSGNIHCTGRFGGAVDFNPGAGVFLLTSAGSQDIFAFKLDADGLFQWAGSWGGNNQESGTAIAVDGGGGVYVAGHYSGTPDFDPGPGQYNLTSEGGSLDIFVSKIDAVGAFQWAKSWGGSGQDNVNGIALDSAGNIYTTGYFSDTADFDPGAAQSILASGGATFNGFVSVLDAPGNFQWAGALVGADLVESYAIAVDSGGNAFVTGYFHSTADFDPGSQSFDLSSTGDDDIFVLRLDASSGPFGAGDDFGQTNADQLLTTLISPPSNSVLANDGGNWIWVFDHNATSLYGALVLVNPDGTFLYDPTAVADFQALAPGESIEDSFNYYITDASVVATGFVTITVFGAGTQLPSATLVGLVALTTVLLIAGIISLGRRGKVTMPPD